MRRKSRRLGAWLLAIAMLCSLFTNTASYVKAASVSVDLKPETGKITTQVGNSGQVEVRFAVPEAYNSMAKLKAAGISKLEVTFKVTGYAGGGSGTPGAQAFLAYGSEGWDSNGSWQNLTAGQTITTTMDLSSHLSDNESVKAYGIQFANISGTFTYEIVSAKLTGAGTWDVSNDFLSLSYTSQNQYNAYTEYKFTLKNSGNREVTGDLVITFDKNREKNWWTTDYNISLNGNRLTVSNVTVPAGGNSKAIQVQLKPMGASITSVSFAGDTIAAEETRLNDSGNSGGTTPADDYNGSLTYTVPADCKDDAASTPLQHHGALHVDAKTLKLTDAKGNPFQLRGVSTHGINWQGNGEYEYEYVNYHSFKSARDVLHANAVRMAMYTAEYNGYTSGGSKKELKYRVDKGVQCATALGMYAIVDWHILNSNPIDNLDDAKEFFAYVSKRYAGNDNVLYELCNEPTGGIWPDIKKYAEQIVPIIRKNDPDAVIIVGTPTWSQDVDIAKDMPLKEADGTLLKNVMYTVHFYAGTHGQSYRDKVEKAVNTIPIFCTEYGMCASSGAGANNFSEATAWLNYLDQNCISYFVWNLSEKDETSSLIAHGSNTYNNWTAANLSESGKWIREQYIAREKVNNIDSGIIEKPTTTQEPATTTTEPKTTQEPATTTTEPKTTQEPATTTTKPATTQEPATTTTEPATTQEPATTTTEPKTTQEPATTTTKPATTQEPATTTTEPATTQEPATTTTEPVTTQEPATTTTEPVTTQEPATTTTKPATTQEPATTTTKPATTQEPAKTTTEPATTTKEPIATTAQQAGTTAGATTTEQNSMAAPVTPEVSVIGMQVTVAMKHIASMLVTKTLQLAPKARVQLTVAFLPENAKKEALTFISSNPKVVKVDSEGVITAGKKPGKATVVIKTDNGIVNTVQIKVVKKAVKKVVLQIPQKNLRIGKSCRVKARITSSKKQTAQGLYWISGNDRIATVTQKGVVKAVAKGKVKITAIATDGSGKKAAVIVKVR